MTSVAPSIGVGRSAQGTSTGQPAVLTLAAEGRQGKKWRAVVERERASATWGLTLTRGQGLKLVP